MGLEAPLALLALAAAGLPILVHLMRRADLPVRELPTIALLRRAEASSRRRMRLVDLLLLIARVLLVVFFALAITRPFLSITLGYGDGTVASVVVVIDDSMSMASRADPTLFERARGRALEIVESLPDGSEVALILAGAPTRVALSRSEDLTAARTTLTELVAAPARGTDLAQALDRAERELAGARHSQRRIVVLSDMARHTHIDEVPYASGVDVRFEAIGRDASTSNAAIVSARAIEDPTTPGMVSIAVEVSATDDLDGETAGLTLERGGEAIANATIEITHGGARATLHAPIDPTDPGATLILDLDDAIDVDDRRGVLIRPPAGARVLVVDGDPDPVRGRGEARFFTRAIDLYPEGGGALLRRTVDPDTFAAMELTDAEVVVLANVPTLDAAAVERIREHVEGGGGLFIAPGDHFDARAVQAAFGDLLPARPLDAISGEVSGPTGTSAAFFDIGPAGLTNTRTQRRITFEGTADATVTMRFGDGSPAMLMAEHGDGTVAVLATSLDDSWTDLPFQPGFLPLVVQAMRRLAPNSSTPDAPVLPGEPVRLRASAGARQLRITTPSGDTLEFDELDQDITIEQTAVPGVYRAEVATRDHPPHEEPRLAFVVAPPASESDLHPVEPPATLDSPQSAASGTVVRRPLAPWLFLLVGLLAIAEAALRLRVPPRASRSSAP